MFRLHKLKGKNNSDLAGYLGISAQALSNKLYRNSFSAADLIRIASFLECDLAFVIDESQKIIFLVLEWLGLLIADLILQVIPTPILEKKTRLMDGDNQSNLCFCSAFLELGKGCVIQFLMFWVLQRA